MFGLSFYYQVTFVYHYQRANSMKSQIYITDSFNGHKDKTRFTFIHEQWKFTVEMILRKCLPTVDKKIEYTSGERLAFPRGFIYLTIGSSREVIWYLRMKQQMPKLSEPIDKQNKLMPVTAITWFMSVTWWPPEWRHD